MRLSQAEKMEITCTVEQAELSIRRTVVELGINRSMKNVVKLQHYFMP